MKRKVFAFLMLIVVIVAISAVNYKAMQTPGTQERMASMIRDAPPYIFYPLWLGLMIIGSLVIYMMTFGYRKWARSATRESVMSAKKVALSLWRVDGDAQTIDDFAVVRFKHLSWGRVSFVLPVRPGHPDLKKFTELQSGDTVEFESLDQGMECALEHELCGFIRIKSVSS